jgi:hypothetical protein
MQVLKTILSELLGLFVDDSSLCIVVIVWAAVCGLSLYGSFVSPALVAMALALGIAVLLAENVVRSARARASRTGAGQ